MAWTIRQTIRSWGNPPNLLSIEYRGFFLRVKAAGVRSWPFTPSSVDVKNRWSYILLPPYVYAFSAVPRGGGCVVQTPPKFRRSSKIVSNSTRLWKLLKIAEFRKPTPQDVRKKGSKILKLPPVRNCFTLAMTNKLVVIINSVKVPKIKKILLYEMKFLVSNYSCLQNPWLEGGLPPPDPRSLCPQLKLLNPLPPEQNSWVQHCMPLWRGQICFTLNT